MIWEASIKNIYIIICKTERQYKPDVRHEEPKDGVLWQPGEVRWRGWLMGGLFKREGTYVYLWPIHAKAWNTHHNIAKQFVVVVQSLSCVQQFVTPWPAYSRLPCPSLSPTVCSNSCQFSRWCHPTSSSSVTPFSCPQSFPPSGSLPMCQIFASGSQNIGASASVLPANISVYSVNIQWFPFGLTGLILLSEDLSGVFSSTTVQKH